MNGNGADAKVYPKQIAFNVLPHIDEFQDNGYTREEMKMLWETRKILGDESILVNATCARVSVFSPSSITPLGIKVSLRSSTMTLSENPSGGNARFFSHFPSGTDAGSVRVYEEPIGGWSGTATEVLILQASDGELRDWFGCSVAATETVMEVGAKGDEPSGSAYIFRNDSLFADGFESGDTSAWSSTVP